MAKPVGATYSISAPADAVKSEGNAGTTVYTFTVTRSSASGPGSLDYVVSGAQANDFAGGSLPNGKVNFKNGQTTATITILVAGDTTVEGNDNFTVALSSPPNGSQIGTGTATGTIQNDDQYQVAIAALAATKPEGNTGTTPFTFTVSRTGGTTDAVTVGYAVTGTATAADFGGTLPSGTVTIPAGQASVTLPIAVTGDTLIEANENFTVTLSSPSSNAQIATATANGTIQNDDQYQVSIAAMDATKFEGNTGTTGFTFTVSRTGGNAEAVTVNYAVTGAANAADFGGVLPAGSVLIPAGQDSATLTINVAGDLLVEANEGFTVTLSNPSSNAGIATATATGTIQNDDQYQVAIAALDASKFEGNSGTTPFTYTVSRTGGTTDAVTVGYAVTGGIDAADFDFGGALPSGTVTIPAGEDSAILTIDVLGDTLVEPNEGFTVTLSNPPSNAQIATATAIGTIHNDDTAPLYQLSVAALDATKAEGNTGTTPSTPFTFTVSRTGGTAGEVTVGYAVTGSDGLDAADFGATLPSGTVTIQDGESSATLTVDVVGDTTVEADEGFTVTLSSPSSNAQLAGATANGTIQNDDPYQLVNVSSAEVQGNNGGLFPSISDGGRYVAFGSMSSNLVPGDTNGGAGDSSSDVFVRDLQSGTTERASVDSNEMQAIGPSNGRGSEGPSISLDGSVIAFSSDSTNLVAGDSNATADVFVRDRSGGGTTELISVGAGGVPANGGSGQASLAAGGRYVAFTSGATNLIAGFVDATGTGGDVFRYDRLNDTTQLVSVTTLGAQAIRAGDPTFTNSNDPSISADGNRVVFVSNASNLDHSRADYSSDVYLRDFSAGTTTLVSVAESGVSGLRSRDPSISADGRYVVFTSATGADPGLEQVYLRDLGLSTTEFISQSTAGDPANFPCFEPSVSADGRYVVFTTSADNLVANDTIFTPDVFLHDREDGTTICISVGANGNPGGGSMPSISPDGRFVSFQTSATLVAGDTNGGADIYVADGLALGWWDPPASPGINTSQAAFTFLDTSAFEDDAGVMSDGLGSFGSLLAEPLSLQGADFIV